MGNIGTADVNAREREWLDSTLGVDEELRLLVRPRSEAEPGQFTWERVMGGIWLVVCLGITLGLMEDDARAGLLMLPAWLVGLGTLCRPCLWRFKRQRMLYAITARRVLCRQPRLLCFHRTYSFPLCENMIQEVGVLPGGYGNIVLGYDWAEYNGAREERVAKQLGLIDIPQVKRVQAVLEEAINQLQERK